MMLSLDHQGLCHHAFFLMVFITFDPRKAFLRAEARADRIGTMTE